MSRKAFTAERIICKLREAEPAQNQGQTVAQVCKKIGVTEQTYYRWKHSGSGLEIRNLMVAHQTDVIIACHDH